MIVGKIMNNLSRIRESKKMNQLALSMKIGVAQETVSAYEMGKSYPSVATLLKLCEVLDVSADFLLDRTDVSTPVDKLLLNNLSTGELELLSVFRRLPAGKRERVIGFMAGMLESAEEKK